MRLVTMQRRGQARTGALLSSGAAVDLTDMLAHVDDRPIASVAELLGRDSGVLRRVADFISNVTQDPAHALDEDRLVAAADLVLLPPMGAKVLLVATSGNYLSHLAEMGMPPPTHVHSFIVSANSLIGSGAVIRLPPAHSTMVDWEGEFCLVFGRACHRVRPDDVSACIAGYTIFNDVSARDWTSKMRSSKPAEAVAAWRSNILFKQFPTFGPIGPAIVTAEEIPDVARLRLTTTVNGRVMQQDFVGAMQFDVNEIVAQLSEIYAFQPGDVVTLGTPAGVGIAQDPPQFLKPGDEVVVSVDGIGSLRNVVAS